MNVHLISGYLGRDPEVSYTTKGTCCTVFSLAHTKHWKNPEGEKQEKTIWINCKAWGKVAETIGEHVKKGCFLVCVGSVETSSWEKQDGSKGYRTETIVEKFEFGPRIKKREDVPDDDENQDINNIPEDKDKSDADLPF